MAAGSCVTHIWCRINQPMAVLIFDGVARTFSGSSGPAVCRRKWRSCAPKSGETWPLTANKQHNRLRRRILGSSVQAFRKISSNRLKVGMRWCGDTQQRPPSKMDRMSIVDNSTLHLMTTTNAFRAFNQISLPERLRLHSFSHKSLERQSPLCRSVHSTLSSQLASTQTDCQDHREEPASQLENVGKPLTPLKKPYLEMDDQLMSYLLAHNNEEEIFARLREETGKLPGAGASMQVRYGTDFKPETFSQIGT